MTEAEQAWKMLNESAVAARLGGITSESSDVVDGADITEGRINPHAVGRTVGQRGGPGAMPPMMMGGAGGAAGAQAGAAQSGAAQAGAAQSGLSGLPGGLAAPGAAGVSSTAGAGGVGASAGAGGIGAAAGGPSGVAAGAHSAPGGVMAAGGTNPDESPSGMLSGTEASEGTTDGDSVAGTHGAGDHRVDGYTVEPERLRQAATGWQAVAHIMGAADQAMQIPHDLGFANVAQGPTNELSQLTKHYAQQASNEFVAIDRRLHGAAGEYDERELHNARLAKEAGRTSK